MLGAEGAHVILSQVRVHLDRVDSRLAFVAKSAVDQLDEVIALFDQAVSAREWRAKAKTDEALVERAKKGQSRAAGPASSFMAESRIRAR